MYKLKMGEPVKIEEGKYVFVCVWYLRVSLGDFTYCSPPPLRSLVSPFSFPHPHRTLADLSRADGNLALHQSLPTRHYAVSQNQGTTYSLRLSNGAPYYIRCSTLVGIVWSHREPAVLWSSPAHPRSWQAPFPCLWLS